MSHSRKDAISQIRKTMQGILDALAIMKLRDTHKRPMCGFRQGQKRITIEIKDQPPRDLHELISNIIDGKNRNA